MGTNTMVAAIGLVLGPVLGGALVSISWQWVFWFNVPLGLAAAAWGALVLRELATPDTERGLDLPGMITFVVGLTGLVLAISKGGISGWNDPVVIVGLVAAAILLPAFVVIERRARAPMLDLTIFGNRLFAAATGAAFINGLSRFALMFVFVFYFQGVIGDDPVLAGVKLAPLALGMLVASPLAGAWADRHGSRALAAAGMIVSAVGLALMTTLGVDSPYWQSCLWLALVGIGSGMFNSPNTAAMMGAVPVHRRGIAAGARTMLQNTGAVLSIAFVMAIVTAAVPKDVLLQIFSGLASGLSPRSSTRSSETCTPRCGCWRRRRCVGAGVSLLRPRTTAAEEADRWRPGGSRRARPRRDGPLRIGDVARAHGHDAAHHPLLRGDRAAARARRRARPAPTASTARATSSASRGAAAQGPARRLARRAARAARAEAPGPRSAANGRRERRARSASARSSARRSGTSSASSSSSCAAARRSAGSRPS